MFSVSALNVRLKFNDNQTLNSTQSNHEAEHQTLK